VKKIFFVLFLLFLTNNNVSAEEEWVFGKLDTFAYGGVSGEITHGDRLRFIMKKNHCDMVQHIFTFYTYEKPKDILQLKGKKIPIKVNGSPLEAKVFMVHPFLMGYQVWFNIGLFQADEYLKLLKVFKTYEIEIVNGSNFNSKKYFDITKNSWKLNKLSESIQKIKDDCRELSDPNEKTIS
jgi:hypothetical protein